MRAITCRMSTGRLWSIGITASNSSASKRGGLKARTGGTGVFRSQSIWAMISRAIRKPSGSSSAR